MRIPIYAMITVPLLIAGSAFGASQKDRDDCNGSGDQALWKVRAGPYADRGGAESARDGIDGKLKLKGLVVTQP